MLVSFTPRSDACLGRGLIGNARNLEQIPLFCKAYQWGNKGFVQSKLESSIKFRYLKWNSNNRKYSPTSYNSHILNLA